MKLPTSINDLQADLVNKKFSALELVYEYLNRIEKFDGEINAYITVTKDEAVARAKSIDKLIESEGKDIKKTKPLFGVPLAHKDMFLTQGTKTTAASNLLRDYVPQYSATVVKKLENAGSIMLGKLNCDAWAHGSSGENSDFGHTKNPWNRDYVPGGSSSGSGAAVSADFALVATGTDTCGSIRLPANFCGVVGLKPTYGMVSRYGVVAMASSLDTVGHLTKTVNDARKIYDITKGTDGNDSTLTTPSYKKPINKITIGIPKEFFTTGVEGETLKKIEEAIEVFKKIGYSFKEISLPHTKYAVSVYYIIQPAEVSSNLSRYDGVRYGETRNHFGKEAKRRIILGSYVLSSGYYDAYYLNAMKVRTVIVEELNKVFENVDALIAPVSPDTPFKLGEKVNDPLKMYLTDVFNATASMAGIPSLALPFGFSSSELPLGFQIMGPRFSEDLLFDIGEGFEQATHYKPSVVNF